LKYTFTEAERTTEALNISDISLVNITTLIMKEANETVKISIKQLNKVFGDGTQALSDVNLVIGEGLFGLLGPNASGKTVLMRILATLSKQTSGTVTIDGMDLQKNRAAIRAMTGYLPQRFSMFTNISTREFLDYTARLAGLREGRTRNTAVDEMLESLGLIEARNRNANELTTVQKRHLAIAQAIIGNPRILIVDEPTVGLSPEERLRFRKLLAERTKKTEIIILSTHILGDISSECTDMAILDKGRIIFHGTPDSLHEHVKQSEMSEKELNDIKTTNSVIAFFSSQQSLAIPPEKTE